MSSVVKMTTTKYAKEFVDFLNASPSPYHAVDNIKKHLLSHGFNELSERDEWNGKVSKKGKYFVTRNNSSIIAFIIGNLWKPGNPIAITGAHTDSPVLRIKPVSKRTTEGFMQIGVECYGGGIWHSWFDSDLSIAGRVFVNEKSTGKCASKLVNLDKPLLKIPTLAIHLDRTVNEKFQFNKESQLLPIAGLSNKDGNNKKNNKGCCNDSKENTEDAKFIKAIVERHHNDLLELIAKEINIESVNEIEDFELILYDNKKSCLGGLHDEFIFSGRLDNLTSCFTSMHGITEATGDIDNEIGIRLMASFDHEEIGSSSAQGADSNFLPNILERLTILNGDDSDISKPNNISKILQSSSKSFFLSSDVAHGVHPNYASKHESNHKPNLGEGPVIKVNANQRYMTNSAGIILIKKISEISKIPLQFFVAANDSPCGSTIGPILASKTGIRTLDLGNAILSMHSIRETGAVKDIEYQIKLFKEFFEKYSKLEQDIIV